MSKNEKIEILVDTPAEYRRFCDDFGEREGCGQEVKIITNAKGKKVACDPVQHPCYDNDGNVVWCWVPHYVTCPTQKGYTIDRMRDKAEKDAEFRARRRKEKAAV